MADVSLTRRVALLGAVASVGFMGHDLAFAQASAGSLPLVVGSGPSGNSYSVPIQTLLFFTALSFLPAVLLMMTGFTRIVIVLSLLRQALGTQSAPPNQVIIGLSLFLTFFVMGPTLDRVYQDAYVPYTNNTISFEQALEKAEAPMRSFMLKQTRQSDFALFSRLARLDSSVTAETAPLRVLVPAFVTSELKSAFQIGFMIFIPFLVIDMVVSSILMSLGMMMLSPVLVALPFKLMLFVLADGWNLLIGLAGCQFCTLKELPMTSQMVLTIGRDALTLLLMISMPVLGVVMAVGLLVSIFQAVTQIHEATLAFVPKLIAAMVVFAIAGPWMLSTLVDFIRGPSNRFLR